MQKRRGRPAGRKKAVVSISLDNDVIAALRKSGSGWQTRLDAATKHVAQKHLSGKLFMMKLKANWPNQLWVNLPKNHISQ